MPQVWYRFFITFIVDEDLFFVCRYAELFRSTRFRLTEGRQKVGEI